MLTLNSREDLERLVSDQAFETLTLEFKASAALNRANDARRELIKDVTAFANAAGGQIVYGIVESNNGTAARLDEGVDASLISPEWIAQVVETNCSPRISGMQVQKVILGVSRAAYVLEIPQATVFAPHQNLMDHKYYRRHDKRAVPMEDYEIRDLINRMAAPHLALSLAFSNGRTDFLPVDDDLNFEIIVKMENISSEPALYSAFDLYLDKRIMLLEAEGWKVASDLEAGEYRFHDLQKLFLTPPDFPLIKGSHVTVGPPFIKLRFPKGVYIGPKEAGGDSMVIGYSTMCAKHSSQNFGVLAMYRDNNRLEILMD